MKFTLLPVVALLAANAAPALAQALKIMPLGDSITEWGCWRQKLWVSLQQSGYTNLDFVGSMNTPSNQCSGSSYDTQHEGHAGYQAVNIADQNQLVTWLSGRNPDIVLVHLGTNDLFANRAINTIVNAISKLVDQMRASNPRVQVLVAQIIPSTRTLQTTVQLNNAIASWAPTKSTANSPVVVVDQYTGFSASGDNGDGVHPNAGGDTKIANRWLDPLKAAIDRARGTGGTPTTTPAGPVVTTVPTTSPPAPTVSTGISVPQYGQCGGQGYTGPTTCASPYTCRKANDWYSQCL